MTDSPMAPNADADTAAKRTPLDRFVGAFAFAFTPMLPLAAGICASACYTVFLEAIARATTRSGLPLPAPADFVFNHFHASLWGLFVLALVLTFASWRQMRSTVEIEIRLGRQLVLAFAGALAGFLFLAFYVIAIAHVLFVAP